MCVTSQPVPTGCPTRVPHLPRVTSNYPPALLKGASPVLGSLLLPGRWHPVKHEAGFICSQLVISFNLNPDGT